MDVRKIKIGHFVAIALAIIAVAYAFDPPRLTAEPELSPSSRLVIRGAE